MKHTNLAEINIKNSAAGDHKSKTATTKCGDNPNTTPILMK